MNPLTAVIMAAGTGERLKPLTDTMPKALIEVGGRPLLDRAVKTLRGAGVDHIAAVTGFEADQVAPYVDETVYNPRYADANNVYSLWMARELVADGCYIVNCDVLFDLKIAEAVVGMRGSGVTCDGSHELDGEAMKTLVGGEGNLSGLSKEAAPEDSVGEYIGLTRIDPADGPLLASILDDFVDADNVQVYYEDAIVELAQKRPLAVARIDGQPWVEIDDFDDLEYAEREIVWRVDSDR